MPWAYAQRISASLNYLKALDLDVATGKSMGRRRRVRSGTKNLHMIGTVAERLKGAPRQYRRPIPSSFGGASLLGSSMIAITGDHRTDTEGRGAGASDRLTALRPLG